MSVSTTAVALWHAASQWSRWTGCGSAVAAVGCMEAARRVHCKLDSTTVMARCLGIPIGIVNMTA
jgi:hypothetical protein